MENNIDPSTEVVKHNGAVIVSWWLVDSYGGEFLQQKTYYGYTEAEALEAWKREYWGE